MAELTKSERERLHDARMALSFAGHDHQEWHDNAPGVPDSMEHRRLAAQEARAARTIFALTGRTPAEDFERGHPWAVPRG